MTGRIRIFNPEHDLGPLWVMWDEDEERVLLDGGRTIYDLGNTEQATLVAKCIEVVAGDGRKEGLTPEERERVEALKDTREP